MVASASGAGRAPVVRESFITSLSNGFCHFINKIKGVVAWFFQTICPCWFSKEPVSVPPEPSPKRALPPIPEGEPGEMTQSWVAVSDTETGPSVRRALNWEELLGDDGNMPADVAAVAAPIIGGARSEARRRSVEIVQQPDVVHGTQRIMQPKAAIDVALTAAYQMLQRIRQDQLVDAFFLDSMIINGMGAYEGRDEGLALQEVINRSSLFEAQPMVSLDVRGLMKTLNVSKSSDGIGIALFFKQGARSSISVMFVHNVGPQIKYYAINPTVNGITFWSKSKSEMISLFGRDNLNVIILKERASAARI